MEPYTGPPLKPGNRWVNRDAFSTGRAIVTGFFVSPQITTEELETAVRDAERVNGTIREEVEVNGPFAEERQECMYCRDPGLEPPMTGSFRRDWDYNKANHVVDKLEPSLPTWHERRVQAAREALPQGTVYQIDGETIPYEDAMAAIDTPKTFEDTFADIFAEAFNLLVDRQRKYGPKNIERLGLFGVLSRLANDKVERVMRGMTGTVKWGEVTIDVVDAQDESFEDALLDIANYALIAIALKRGLWGLPLREELDGK